jgi:hypothetical protein
MKRVRHHLTYYNWLKTIVIYIDRKICKMLTVNQTLETSLLSISLTVSCVDLIKTEHLQHKLLPIESAAKLNIKCR